MDKKKALLVILFATILAFVAVFTITRKNTTEEIPEIETQQEVTIENPDNENTNINEDAPEVKEEDEQAPIIKTDIKPIVKPIAPTIEHPVIKPLQVEDAKGEFEKQNVDAGILKETGSNDIVITREFKATSQAKYTFEGYGVQKAPTK